MSPRTALVAVAALLAAVGVAALVRAFGEERAELRAAVASEREAVELEVGRALEGAVRAHLEVARLRVARALEDPLYDAPRTLAIEDGRLAWPRPAGSAVDDRLDLAVWRTRLSTATPATADDPLSERARLLAELRRSARAGDDRAMTHTFRALLVARARDVIDPRAELEVAVTSLEALGRNASPAILRAVLSDGLRDPRFGEIEPAARLLARTRARLSRGDVAAWCARATALARAQAVDTRVLERACRLDEVRVPPEVLAATATTAPIRVGSWWLLRDGARTVGAEIDMEAELAAQSRRLAERGLAGARVWLDGDRARVEAPRWPEVEARAAAWYVRKLALLALAVAVIVGAAAALVALRAQALRREREVVELKARFAATVSHELQTPLAAVRVMAETLERRLEGEPRARDYPRRIVAEVDRLGGLVDNILAFQRIEQGRWEVRRERVRLDDVVPELIDEAERATHGQVVVDASAMVGAELDADPRLLRLALLNLVRNACRHNQRRPVEIALAARGSTLEIKDNGVGVSGEEIPRLFEENARGRGAVGQGTGLGLALVARIARLHGGEARLVTTSDAGSTFALVLEPP